MKTLTLPESEIITLADAAKKHGTVELAKAIGIGKTQLYRILRGHNRVTPATADKISAWLDADAPKPEKPQESPKSEQRRTRRTSPSCFFIPDHYWLDPQFIQLAAMQVAEAALQGRLKNVTIVLGGACKCGD